MYREHYPIAAAAIASLFAGPIFLVSFAGAALYLQLPAPIALDWSDALGFAFAFIPALMIGTVLALVPNILGTLLMVRLGDLSEAARLPEIWALAGGLIGAAIVWAGSFDGIDPAFLFATVATSAACALICRSRMAWD